MSATATPPPLFILAAPFSGASWLAGVLGRHPGLYALPQVFLAFPIPFPFLAAFGATGLGVG